ncbi:hypothetical protein N9Y42_04740 [Mariniblastus sp.]|nr:hypothetical protein [Mariniblastus sp.]
MRQLLKTLRSIRNTKRDKTSTTSSSSEFFVEPLEDRLMLSTVSVFASGTTGDEIVNVQIDGLGTLATIDSLSTDAVQEFQYFVDEPVTADDIRIEFVNDFNDPNTGIDRNVLVDRIEVDGIIYQTENAAVFSTGTWTAADGLQPGFGRGAALHTNGYLQYSNAGFGGVANTTYIEAELEIAGITSQIEVDVLVDDQVVDTWLLNGPANTSQVFGYRAQGDISPDQIKLAFTNDVFVTNPDGSVAVDNNAQFNSITIDGVNYDPLSENVFSTGTWRAEDGITPGFGRGNVLHSNGFFQFFDTTQGTEIVIDARGFGDVVDFELQIDEVAVASYSFNQSIGYTQDVIVYQATGNTNPEQVRIEFTNDAIFTDPISGETIDRNLQIRSVSIGGVLFDPDNANVYSTGTWRPDDGLIPGFGRGDFLQANGYFEFSSILPEARQVIYQNDFDQHSAGLYTRELLDGDWNDPRFNDGVDEGRVTIVNGQEAFGGTGNSLAVAYPEDQVGTKETGAQWQLELDGEYEEAYVSYRVQFAEGFDFSRGGKLPGLAGGSAPTGNAPAEGDNGWTGRLMWLSDFTGEPGEPEQLVSQAISYAKYTDSGFNQDGRDEDETHWIDPDGDRTEFNSGVWYQITQRVVMNTPGVSDGVIQVWLDGVLVHDQTDVLFRTVDDLKIDQVYFSTFFGGGEGWETTKDETVFFDDFEVSVPLEV